MIVDILDMIDNTSLYPQLSDLSDRLTYLTFSPLVKFQKKKFNVPPQLYMDIIKTIQDNIQIKNILKRTLLNYTRGSPGC